MEKEITLTIRGDFNELRRAEKMVSGGLVEIIDQLNHEHAFDDILLALADYAKRQQKAECGVDSDMYRAWKCWNDLIHELVDHMELDDPYTWNVAKDRRPRPLGLAEKVIK